MKVAFELDDQALEAIARRAAELVLEQLGDRVAGVDVGEFLDVDAACAFLGGCKPQRIYDLRSSGVLTRHSDGAKVLVSRAELLAHVGAQSLAPAELRRKVA